MFLGQFGCCGRAELVRIALSPVVFEISRVRTQFLGIAIGAAMTVVFHGAPSYSKSVGNHKKSFKSVVKNI